MQFNSDLAAIHGYLCADGYVVRNPVTQKHKYYHIALRNTNTILLEDFQKKFFNVFGIKPRIVEGRCIAQSKEIFHRLTEDYSYYSYEWKLPRLSNDNLRFWIRAFFDCESWVELQQAKSRSIRVDCVNYSGLKSVKKSLEKFGIDSTIKQRKENMWRLSVCGLDDIKKFEKYIGFLHPDKKHKLSEAINSYRNFEWAIPKEKDELIKFIYSKGKLSAKRKEIRLYSIRKENLEQLETYLRKYGITSRLLGPWKNKYGSIYYCLSINKRYLEWNKENGTKRNEEDNRQHLGNS